MEESVAGERLMRSQEAGWASGRRHEAVRAGDAVRKVGMEAFDGLFGCKQSQRRRSRRNLRSSLEAASGDSGGPKQVEASREPRPKFSRPYYQTQVVELKV
jgi:hypothetical protein